MLTPIDIREKEFDRGRGYTREVRTFLAKVAGEYEVLYSKNAELTDRIAQLEALLNNYENMEDSMKNALVLAQRTADSSIESANKEAQNILLNARMKAEELLIESIDKNNRIKLANKNLMERFNLYKQQCAQFLEQHKLLLENTQIEFDEEDINVTLEKIYPEIVSETEEALGYGDYADDYYYEDEELAEDDLTDEYEVFDEAGDDPVYDELSQPENIDREEIQDIEEMDDFDELVDEEPADEASDEKKE
ncbi:MAG: DivIVA domain-containing protein [Eubacteriales bacterium]|nr:DivIVA domain-containing protein [Eubacteriales bacterium]